MFELLKNIGRLIFHSGIFVILMTVLVFEIIGAVKIIF